MEIFQQRATVTLILLRLPVMKATILSYQIRLGVRQTGSGAHIKHVNVSLLGIFAIKAILHIFE